MTLESAPSLTTARRVVGVLRIAAAIALFVTMSMQIANRVQNNAFDPAEYFSYFTIQACLIAIVVLVVGGVMALHRPTDTVLYTTIRMSALAYAIVTAGVYNLLLRNVPYEGFVGITWPNEVMHVWVPLFILLDWLFSPGRPGLPWSAVRVVAVFPVAWIAYTLIRGAFTNYYPYPFLDPATGGWVSVVIYIVALTGFLVGLAALAVLYSRRRARAALSD